MSKTVEQDPKFLEQLAEVQRLRAELDALKQRALIDVVKLPMSEDLYRIRPDGVVGERPDTVVIVSTYQKPKAAEAGKDTAEAVGLLMDLLDRLKAAGVDPEAVGRPEPENDEE